MPNIIVGLKYESDPIEITTENGLQTMLQELKESYEKISKNFKIILPNGKNVENLKEFIESATKTSDLKVLLFGKGNLFGLQIDNTDPYMDKGFVSYDLSEVHEKINGWDFKVEIKCGNCEHFYGCILKKEEYKREDAMNCGKFSPDLINHKGEPARPLDEILKEFLER